MNFCSAFLATALAVGVIATPVNAAERLFRLFGDADASFLLPGSPTPSAVAGNFFAIYNTAAIVNGVSNNFDLYFYLSSIGGGFDYQGVADPDVLLQTSGPQLFTGSTAAPTFINGTYALGEFGGGPGNYTLVISDVPEPASWAMLIAGFGLTGAAMRRYRNREHAAAPISS